MIGYKIAGLALPMAIALSSTCLAAPSISPNAGQAQPGLSTNIQKAQANVEILSPNAPPPPRVETVPPPPTTDPTVYFWRPGHWNWDGTNWNWTSGQYIQRPQPTAVWQPGQWVQQPNGWSWIDGHWQQ